MSKKPTLKTKAIKSSNKGEPNLTSRTVPVDPVVY